MNESIEFDETWGQRLIQVYSTPDVLKQREIILYLRRIALIRDCLEPFPIEFLTQDEIVR